MTEEYNITVVKLKRWNKNSKSNKNIKYLYINTWITNKITNRIMTLSILHKTGVSGIYEFCREINLHM